MSFSFYSLTKFELKVIAMKAVTFKGLVLRMAGAFVAICAIMEAMPAHAYPVGMPAPPTVQQHQQAEERLAQLRQARAAQADAIGNVRPMATFDEKVPEGSLANGEVFMEEKKQ